MDAGWGWEAFFKMIVRNIDPNTIVAPVRILCFGHLRPITLSARMVLTHNGTPSAQINLAWTSATG
jgi:hypothetical protein